MNTYILPMFVNLLINKWYFGVVYRYTTVTIVTMNKKKEKGKKEGERESEKEQTKTARHISTNRCERSCDGRMTHLLYLNTNIGTLETSRLFVRSRISILRSISVTVQPIAA